VADQFIEHGYAVTVLDNLSSGDRANVPAEAEFVETSITSDDASRLVREGGFDVIAHLAAQIDVRKSVADPVFDATVNVVGTLNLLEAVRASRGPTRFVFSSTGGALYGDFVTPPNDEEFPKDPESPYGIAKLSAEYYMAYYSRLHGLEGVALRYANVYGPRQNPHGEAGVVAIFCNRLLSDEPVTIFGDGRQTRDYVHVDDVVAAFLAAAEQPQAVGARVNIGTGVETSVLELYAALREVAGFGPEPTFAPARQGELQRIALDAAAAGRALDWRPEISLAEGLAGTWAWAFQEVNAGSVGG
ncbi:MAG TPA: NAD-dependent epimerase/dehydratase family protein, partial [Actinomycetes bacterium]